MGHLAEDFGSLREGVNGKKNVFFRALPESPKPPPLTPIRATWSSFLDVKNDVLRVWLIFFFDDDNDGFNDNYDDNFGNFDDNYDKND